MHIYETVFAIPSTLPAEEKDQSIKEVEGFIVEIGGSVKSSEEIGERKMAYKIEGHERAYYHLIRFDCPSDGIDKLKKHYQIKSNYIRNIVVTEE